MGVYISVTVRSLVAMLCFPCKLPGLQMGWFPVAVSANTHEDCLPKYIR